MKRYLTHDLETPKPAWFKRDIRKPASEFERKAVIHVQRVLRCNETGEMDEDTVSHILGLQNAFGLNPTGILDEPTAKQIERIRSFRATQGG